jgi:hypothetical protein
MHLQNHAERFRGTHCYTVWRIVNNMILIIIELFKKSGEEDLGH